MPISSSNDQSSYSPGVAFIFIFNLIVGTGALALPAAFGDAGWLTSSIIVTAICLTSFISLTFVVETMSIANYICKSGTCLFRSSSPIDPDEEQDERITSSLNVESTPLITGSDQPAPQDDSYLFEITEQMELGHMAKMFFKKHHLKYFYICIIIYLYGDLTIYSTAISKSLRDVTCNYENCHKADLEASDPCWQNLAISREQVYRLYILVIALFLGPFFKLNSKYLQLLTSIFRWLAFTSMIILASIALIEGKGEGRPPKSNLNKLPNLFGVAVYSFMCHHSLPRLITPLKSKRNIYRLLSFDYALVLFFYLLLSLTGVFTFKMVEDVYTLNFQKPRCAVPSNLTANNDSVVPQFQILELFLPLFPVFTLSTNFPIIAVTLANNLKALLLRERFSSSRNNLTRESLSSRLLFPLIVFVPPILISFLSENVELAVSLTGSYGGTCIQYLIPLFLVYNARLSVQKIESSEHEQLSLRSAENLDNLDYSFASSTVPRRALNKTLFVKHFQSSFRGNFWTIFILLWSVVCLVLVSIDHVVFWFDIQI